MTMKKAEHNTSYICNIASQSYCNFAYMTMYALIVRPHQAGACITMFEMITVTSAVPLAVCTSSCCCEIRRKLHSQAASGCLGWLCMLLYEIGVMISLTDMYVHKHKFVQEKALRDATDAGARDLVEALSQLDEMVRHYILSEIKKQPNNIT